MAQPKLTVRTPPEGDGSRADGYQWESADSGKAVKMPYLLPCRVVQNGLAILEGDSNAGKSTFLCHLAAAVTTGAKWMGRPKQPPRSVLWLTAEEDHYSMVQPRLVKAGCDLSRVKWPQADGMGVIRQVYFPQHVQVLYDAVERYDLALIVIEPLVSFVPSDLSLNIEQSARCVVDPLNQLAIRTKCCIVVTRGLKKDRRGPRSTHGSGHHSIFQTARSVIVIDRPNSELPGRVLRVLKCGGTRDTPALAYDLVGPKGEPPVMANVAELPVEKDDYASDQLDLGERGVMAEARLLLRTILEKDYVPSKEVIQAAKDAGIGERSLNKVKAELKIHSKHERQARPYFVAWGPPLGGWPPPPDTHSATTESAPLPKKPRKKRQK